MTDVNKIKEDIRKNVNISNVTDHPKGGQSVSSHGAKLTSEELGLGVTIGYSRSQYWNREMVMKLFEKAMDLIVKEEIEQLPTQVDDQYEINLQARVGESVIVDKWFLIDVNNLPNPDAVEAYIESGILRVAGHPLKPVEDE
jgi:hypothetical protein